MNTNKDNTQLPFQSRKKIGQSVEREFIELIAVMGGTAQALATVPAHSDPTPRFCRPHSTSENGFHYSVSPDIVFTLPDQPRGFASLAQVKKKKVYSERSKGWLFVYLDQKELDRMKMAAGFYDVFFVIHTPDLTEQPDFSDWLWLNVDDLKQIELIRRTVSGKKVFLLPLNLFQPLSTLKKEPLNEPANHDPAPEDASL